MATFENNRLIADLKVLVAPLNWGLGHATRVIPVINEWLQRGAEVLIASDGASLSLLQKEYPTIKLFELPAWDIRYPEKGKLSWQLLKQLPSVLKAIKKEHSVLEKLVIQEKVDLVISDSRPGCYSEKVKSVIMTHQLFIESPVLKNLINYFNHKMLKRFSEVWVVDVPGKDNLAGRLSYRDNINLSVKHLGVISRFSNGEFAADIEILAIISGPEPQRTLFEQELLPKLQKLNRKTVVVLGKPEGKGSASVKGNVKVFPHVKGGELEDYFRSAEMVISRSGYTTLMDLAVLNKKALLVPTPGQPEQEYLADHCRQQGWFTIQKQGSIDLSVLDSINAPENIPCDSFISAVVASI